MPLNVFILTLSLIASNPLWAITCYFTLAKNNCWLKYNVNVEVLSATNGKVITTVTVPAGKLWTRQIFPCEVNQKLMYRAQFSPPIWESEKGKVYYAINYWSLPDKINPGDSAWNVSVCYPSNFAQVPLPPEATSECKCDFESIPVIPPKQI